MSEISGDEDMIDKFLFSFWKYISHVKHFNISFKFEMMKNNDNFLTLQ